VRAKMFVDGRLNPDMVGQSAYGLGKLFGVNVPRKYKVGVRERMMSVLRGRGCAADDPVACLIVLAAWGVNGASHRPTSHRPYSNHPRPCLLNTTHPLCV